MDRPVAYRDSYVVNRNFPYEMVERLPYGEYLGGGVLGKGQLVWMQHQAPSTSYCHAVAVYAENIGIVHLDPHCLSRLDLCGPGLRQTLSQKRTKRGSIADGEHLARTERVR